MADESNSMVPTAPSCRDPPVLADRRGVAIILWRVLTTAEKRPLEPPQAPPDLPEMPALVRIYACLRLFLLDVEYALSSSGHLRGLCKLAIRVNVVAAVLSTCLGGILACVATVLAGVVIITGQIVQVLWNLLVSVLLLMALVAIAGVCVMVMRLLVGSSGNDRGRA